MNQKASSYDESIKIQNILYDVTLALYALCLVVSVLMFVVGAAAALVSVLPLALLALCAASGTLGTCLQLLRPLR